MRVLADWGEPLSWQRAVMVLLPKRGDLCLVQNWLLVSLLCTDYKLFAMVMANHLGSMLPYMIHPD